MKLKFFCIFYFIIYSFVFANNLQKPDYIFDDKRILEEAIEDIDNIEYGDALNYALKAKESRKAQNRAHSETNVQRTKRI